MKLNFSEKGLIFGRAKRGVSVDRSRGQGTTKVVTSLLLRGGVGCRSWGFGKLISGDITCISYTIFVRYRTDIIYNPSHAFRKGLGVHLMDFENGFRELSLVFRLRFA